MSTAPANSGQSSKVWSIRFLLFIAGLGGLLYGIDVGIIAGALPYMKETSGLDANKLSFIVAAVLLGTVISTPFAGMLAELFGRKKMMASSGLLFVISIPLIATSTDDSYGQLVAGRLLQGLSGGLIGIAVPLYLAECLSASTRGKGTGIFQWLLTLGIVTAALIGNAFSMYVDHVKALGDPEMLRIAQGLAWRGIFWVSLPPGVLFVLGVLFLPESPRWLFRRGRKDAALAALLRSRTDEQAEVEIAEMEATAAAERVAVGGSQAKESLFHRKYLIPFALACVILGCNQLTGVNSIIGYCPTVLIQAGLSDVQAHAGHTILTTVNVLVTVIGVVLVDRKGRKFLLSLGTAGIVVSLACTGAIFQQTEKHGVDCKEAVQKLVANDQDLKIVFDQVKAGELLAKTGASGQSIAGRPATLSVIYSFGDYVVAANVVRSDDRAAKPLEITRKDSLPGNSFQAFMQNPLGDLGAAQTAPLKIQNAIITPVPSVQNGWLTAVFIYLFMAFFAVGPGVCVWLALSELMPTRIRSNGMSIAMFLNQTAATVIAAIFLPTVGKYGYSSMFFAFAAFTIIYFVTAAFFLPETKGKTLEEIEELFSRHVKGK
jgi:SP family myo-inositol transporter-like MFS transporter 13